MDTNTQAAESAIKDTNYAKTMSDFTRYQIATQAGVAMLSQADQLPQQILTLLKNG
jgi:flagellin